MPEPGEYGYEEPHEDLLLKLDAIERVFERVARLAPDAWSDDEIENADSEDYGRYMGRLETLDDVQAILREELGEL